MDGIFRREGTTDPNEQVQRVMERRLNTQGVGNPGKRGPRDAGKNSLSSAISNAAGLITAHAEQQDQKEQQAAFNNGVIQFSQGATEAAISETGNRHTMAGWQSMNVKTTLNDWYNGSVTEIDKSDHTMDPAEYAKKLNKTFNMITDNMGQDPFIREQLAKQSSAIFADLASKQMLANNAHNRTQAMAGAYDALVSGKDASPVSAVSPADAAADAGPGSTVTNKVTQRTPASHIDRDVLINTVLGEAEGEGADGWAAVAHVILNRTRSKNFPDSITGVALQPKQFSANNKKKLGGNDRGSKNNPLYEEVGRVVDAVLSGQISDATGGATNYFSPSGMKHAVKSGSANGLIPSWYTAMHKKYGSVKIGGHVFTGRADGTHKPANSVTATAKETLLSSGLSGKDAVQVAGQAMIDTLKGGSRKLYDDLGGAGLLRQIGAKPSQVNAVTSALKAYEDMQLSKHSQDYQVQLDEITDAVGSGKMTQQAGLDKLNELHKAFPRTEGMMKAATRSVLQEANQWHDRAEVDKLNNNPEFRSYISTISRKVVDGGMSREDADKEVLERAEREDWPRDVVKTVLSRLTSSESRRASAEATAIKTAAKKRLKLEQDTSTAVNAVNTSTTGTLTSAQKDLAIQHIRNEEQQAALQAQEGNPLATVQNTAQVIFKNVMTRLAKHDLVDKSMVSQFRAALINPTETKGGKTRVRPAAVEAYSAYLDLKKMPGVTPQYLGKLFPDAQHLAFLETVTELDAGDMNTPLAIVKANEIASRTIDPNAFARTIAPAEVDRVLNTVATGTNGTWSEWITGVMDPGALNVLSRASAAGPGDVFDSEIEAVQNSATAKNFIRSEYRRLAVASPNLPPEALAKAAQQSFMARAEHVMGSIIVGEPGRTLKDDMGLGGFTKMNTPHKAMVDYLSEKGKELFGAKFSEFHFTSPVESVADAVRGVPEMYVEYNQRDKVFIVDMFKDKDRQHVLGAPVVISAQHLGDWYKERNKPSDRVEPARTHTRIKDN